jgi:hypothetical protein
VARVRDQVDLVDIEIQGHVVVERRRNQDRVQMRDASVQDKLDKFF